MAGLVDASCATCLVRCIRILALGIDAKDGVKRAELHQAGGERHDTDDADNHVPLSGEYTRDCHADHDDTEENTDKHIKETDVGFHGLAPVES